jgi:serine/threonine protein kinase
MFCGRCGKSNVDGVEFCVHCGADLQRMTPPADSLSDSKTIDGPSQPAEEGSLGDMPTIDGPGQLSLDASLGDLRTIAGESAASFEVGDRFEILEELGRGGMGVVYKAHDRKLGRTVALKCLHAHTAESRKAVERFWREAKVVASLNHFNIVQIFDVLEDTRMLWIVMEYLSGGSLEAKLDHDGAFEREQVRQIGFQLAGALASAHEKGVIHRDVKPANILLTDRGTPKLGDFGLAREADNQVGMTLAGSQMGTLYYAAPEQMVSGGLVDERSDIYALGATLYALATGEPPRSIRLDRVDKSLRDILARCLEEHPDKRYPTDTALIEALQAGAGPGVVSSDVGCPSCGHVNPIDMRFCQKCGGDLSSLLEKCPKCQRENRKDNEFCGGCGLDLIAYRAFWKDFESRAGSISTDEALDLLWAAQQRLPEDDKLDAEIKRFRARRMAPAYEAFWKDFEARVDSSSPKDALALLRAGLERFPGNKKIAVEIERLQHSIRASEQRQEARRYRRTCLVRGSITVAALVGIFVAVGLFLLSNPADGLGLFVVSLGTIWILNRWRTGQS